MTGRAADAPLPAWVEDDLRAAIDVAGDGASARDSALWERLYIQWYQRHNKVAAKRSRCDPHMVSMIECFRAAHADTWRFEDGWRAAAPPRGWRPRGIGHVLAEKESETRVLVSIDYVSTQRPGHPPRPGESLSATARRDIVSGGFWTTYSQAWLSVPNETPILRLYWNVGAEGAVALVRTWTERFAGDVEPFMIKALALAHVYGRADAVVIYLPAERMRDLLPAVHAVHEALATWLDAPSPRLTKPLAPGLAVAEDPGRDQSFGEHRCRLMAEALAATPADPMAEILARFRAEGLRPVTPHLNPGSAQDIDW